MKTICIYHSRDLDGWMSAAIVNHWFNQQEVPNKEGEDINTIDFLGWDYGDEMPNLTEYDKVIMVDISFPKEEMDKLYNRLQYNFIWIDHHVSAIKEWGMDAFLPTGIQATNFAACELTWQYFFTNDEIPEIVRLLGRYDCFGHKGTDEEQKVLEFQYGARQVISNYEDAYRYLLEVTIYDEVWKDKQIGKRVVQTIGEAGKYIYQYLCTEAKQTYVKAFPIEFASWHMRESSHATHANQRTHKFLCVNQERFNPVNFGIDYHKDGYDGFACFWYNDNKWHFSLYNDNDQVDCSAIAKQYGGGGHKGAAGFVVEDINKVIKQ